MICRRCGKKADRGWRFCPNCGSSLEQQGRSIFDDIFARFRREFGEMDKMFDKEFEVLDLSPFFRARSPEGAPRPRSSGFTIKITRRNREHPRVDVKTFGNVDRNEVRREVAEEMKDLGIKAAPMGALQKERRHERPKPLEKPQQEPAKFTEEPRTHVRSVGTRVTVEMELPDVKSEGDIEINELESSVEVRARAGDKAYFKIITKPERFSVTSKRFERGRLYLEFS
jgi:HSP20 family molecular chaperone IbpA